MITYSKNTAMAKSFYPLLTLIASGTDRELATIVVFGQRKARDAETRPAILDVAAMHSYSHLIQFESSRPRPGLLGNAHDRPSSAVAIRPPHQETNRVANFQQGDDHLPLAQGAL
jgi:hypothetical protein